MKFEVFKNKNRVFICTEKECLPDIETIRSANTNGYKFKINGKVAAIRAVTTFSKENTA